MQNSVKIICAQTFSFQIITKCCVRYTYAAHSIWDVHDTTDLCCNLVGYHSLCCGWRITTVWVKNYHTWLVPWA